jgi:hypothetical protein
MEKSHVGMGVSVCPVCGKEHNEVVLLNTRLKNTLTNHMFMGWELCPVHKTMFDEGCIALIECKNQPKNLNDADRTGLVAHVSAEAFPKIFNTPAPKNQFNLAFVEEGVLAKLGESYGVCN